MTTTESIIVESPKEESSATATAGMEMEYWHAMKCDYAK